MTTGVNIHGVKNLRADCEDGRGFAWLTLTDDKGNTVTFFFEGENMRRVEQLVKAINEVMGEKEGELLTCHS